MIGTSIMVSVTSARHEQTGVPTQRAETTLFFSVTLKAFPSSTLVVN